VFDTLSGRLESAFKSLRGKGRLSDADIDATAREIRIALLEADVALPVVKDFIDAVKERSRGAAVSQALNPAQQVISIVNEELVRILGGETRRLRYAKNPPTVIMLAGLQGSGKTTLAGKLAKWLQGRGGKVMLAAGDTFRAAAREQLAAWGERNGVPVIGQQGGDPGAVVFDAIGAAGARGIDVLIADTAGRLPTQLHLMEEIKKMKRVIAKAMPGAPHETLLVLDAGTGQNAIAQVKAFDDALGLTGLILTKLDGSARGGVILAIAKTRPIPLLFIGIGEGIDDLRPFVAADFVEALVD